MTLLLTPSIVRGQSLGGQRFFPAASEDSIFETVGADPRPLYHPYIGFWMHYALQPIVLLDADSELYARPIQHVIGADLVTTITVWRGLEFGLGFPLTLYSWGDDAETEAVGLAPAPGFALGDMTVRVGYRFRITDRTALALHVPVLINTSQAISDNLLGLGWGVRPTIALLHRAGPVELLFNVFYLGRPSVHALDYHGGQELGLRFGLRVALSNWWTSFLLEAGFSTSLTNFFSAANTPAEVRAGIEHWFGGRVRLAGFVGTGISPGVGAPDFRAGIAVAYGRSPWYRPRPTPTPDDRDGDGILDENDRCPDEPEDMDGFQDRDGCPDDDNDNDRIPDVYDNCPNAPETYNGISDEDGCPDRIRVESTLIVTFEPIRFVTGSDEIYEQSHPMLEEIAAVLIVNPDFHIRIEGHTDSVGDYETNQELSEQRAQSVRRFLMDQGVPGSQLEAVGMSEDHPVASNEERDGRALNRRVEFHIIQEDE